MKATANSFNNFFKKIGANLALEAYITKQIQNYTKTLSPKTNFWKHLSY